MFYAQFVLSKKGPLAKIWLAAHWERKLTKAQVFETNIDKAVESILEPKIKMALRTTGHLLLGVVRIYSRKAKYLLADCNEAFLKIKMAFRPGAIVDLVQDEAHSLTLPEVFHDFDSVLPDVSDADYMQDASLNQSRLEDITIKEDNQIISHSFGFPDEGFGATDDIDSIEINRASEGQSFKFSSLSADKTSGPPATSLFDAPIQDDFGEGLDLDDDRNFINAPAELDSIGSREDFEPGAASPGPLNEPSKCNAPSSVATVSTKEGTKFTGETTTLIHNIEEGYHLPPQDVTVITGVERRPKRKRRLLVDELKSITGEDMKMQLNYYHDILTSMDLAPPTRKLMGFKETGSVDRLMTSPGYLGLSKQLSNLCTYNLQCKTKRKIIDDFDTECPWLLEGPLRGATKSQRPSVEGTMPQIEEESFEGESTVEMARDGTLLHAITEESMNTQLVDDILNDFQGPPSVPENCSGSPPPNINEQPSSTHTSPRKDRRSKVHKDNVVAEPVSLDDELELMDETGEDVDRRWKSRTESLLSTIRNKLRDRDYINFVDLCARRDNKKVAAQKFYSLLVLKKWQAVNVEQIEPYADIQISRGMNIDTSMAS